MLGPFLYGRKYGSSIVAETRTRRTPSSSDASLVRRFALTMHTTTGLQVINEALDAPSTIRIDASDMGMDGFMDDTFSEYRQRSAVRTAPGGALSFTAPDCGRRYLGFVIYDSAEEEEVEVWIDGVKRGTAVVDGNNQRERLFTLSEPHDFRGGEQVRLATPQEQVDTNGQGSSKPEWEGDLGIEGRIRRIGGETYRIECAALFTELPPETGLSCEFQHVHAEPVFPEADNGDDHSEASAVPARLTWVTTWDARCRVEYWAQGTSETLTIGESGPGANHRVILEGLALETTYCCRISALDRHGTRVESRVHTFKTSRPLPAEGSAVLERLALTVRNPSDVARTGTPVRSSVPFPQGVLGSSRTMRLLNESGKELPLQTRTLGRWPDGTVKWALADFQADVPASSEAEYAVEYGSAVRRGTLGTPLRVSEDAGGVTVETGRLRIRWDASKFGPFSEIRRDGEKYVDGSEVVVTGADGREYRSIHAEADTLEIEESGPVHCIVRAEGTHVSEDGAGLLRSVFRVHAYAGVGYVRVDHTFINDNFATPFTDIESLYLRIGTADGEPVESREIVQTHDDRSMVNGAAGDARLRGRGVAGGVELEVEDFWQQYPKSLRTSADGIEIGLCPAIGEDDYRVGGEEEYKLYFYLKDGMYRFREGISKTHTIYVGEDLSDAASPLMGQASVEWNCASGAFGEVTPGGDGRFPNYEERVGRIFDEYRESHDLNREYGLLNFGDWAFDNYKDWGNSEYDTGYVFFTQWARTGDARYFEEAHRAVLHHRDVDTCHISADEFRVGGVYRHRVGHTGDLHPGGYGLADRAIATGDFPETKLWVDLVESRELRAVLIWGGEFTISHTWVDGFLLHYFLTGDPRSLETAKTVADRYDGHYSRSYEFTNGRNNGWHLILAMAMYNATGDRFHLNAAHIIVDRTLERQTEDGGWRRMLVPAHCHCDPPRHMGNAGFMVGILLVGLRLYHQATGDPKIGDSILRAAKFLVDDMWVEESAGFRATSCPHARVSTDNFQHGLAGLSYAWRLSGDPELGDIVRRAVPNAIEALQAHGRILGSQLRAAPEVLYAVAQMDRTDAP